MYMCRFRNAWKNLDIYLRFSYVNECILHMLYVCIITILKYHIPGINYLLGLVHNSLYIFIFWGVTWSVTYLYVKWNIYLKHTWFDSLSCKRETHKSCIHWLFFNILFSCLLFLMWYSFCYCSTKNVLSLFMYNHLNIKDFMHNHFNIKVRLDKNNG